MDTMEGVELEAVVPAMEGPENPDLFHPQAEEELPVEPSDQPVMDGQDSALPIEGEMTAKLESLEPCISMEFDSPESARAFYEAYAERLGFLVRSKGSNTSRLDDTIIMRKYVCSKEGYPTKKDETGTKKKRNRASSREGCKAMFQVNRRGEGKWLVTKFAPEHNHPLGVSVRVKKAKPTKASPLPEELALLEGTKGRLSDHNCGDRNCRNYSIRQDIFGVVGGEAQSLLEYFKRKQVKNPAFFYAIQVDSFNYVTNIFWADARARTAYEYFGDSVWLDTSYRNNKQMLPFAVFTGVNHHLQPVVFGCAILVDDSAASFVWLFETWLTAMRGHHPISLVTDKDEAIEMAVSEVLLKTRHRFCKWSILSECKESFNGELKKCIDESETVEEFESDWMSIINKYDLKDNTWLQLLYKIRERWVAVYFKDTFFAEMSPDQRSESMSKFFERHFNIKTTLREFVTQFDQTMVSQYEKEVQADFVTMYSKPNFKSLSSMVREAADVYTRTIFDIFQEECVKSNSCSLNKIEDGTISKYRVVNGEDDSKIFTVTFHDSEKRVSCSCCKFEFSGVLCRHVLKVFSEVGILTLPKEYILKRWTMSAKSPVLTYDQGIDLQSSRQKAVALCCNDLCRDVIKYAEEGATSAVMYKIAKEALQKAFAEVITAKKDVRLVEPSLLHASDSFCS